MNGGVRNALSYLASIGESGFRSRQTAWPIRLGEMDEYEVSDRVAELMRAGAERVLGAPGSLFERIDAASLAEHDPAVAADPVLLATFRRATRAMIRHWANSVLADPGGRVLPFLGPEGLAWARDLVRRGFGASALEPYRAAQNVAWAAWMEILFSLTEDATELPAVLRVSSRSIFAFVDATNTAIIEAIDREREDLTRGTNAERLETVALVLDKAPIDLGMAALRLGYDFNRAHLAAIVWSDDPCEDDETLRGAAERLSSAAGASRPLTVTASNQTLWVWLAVSTEPDLARLGRSLIDLPSARVALGSRRHGVEGFRTSHFDAFATQRLVSRLSSPSQLSSHDDVKVVSLLVNDEPRVRTFVDETLGELVNGPRVLAETLRTYLRLQSSATRTASRLHTHRNTVVSRIDRAQALLPRPLGESAFDVGVALELLHWSAAVDPTG